MRQEAALTDDIGLLFERAEQSARGVEQARDLMSHYAQQRRRAVVALRMRGLSYGEIARRLGCSRSAIQSIVRASSETE